MSSTNGDTLKLMFVGAIILALLVAFISSEKPRAEVTLTVGVLGALSVIVFVCCSSSVSHPFDEIVNHQSSSSQLFSNSVSAHHPKSATDTDQELLLKEIPELKRSDVELSHSRQARVYTPNIHLADAINVRTNPELVPASNSGLAFCNVLKYLRKHNVLKHSTDLNINAQYSKTVATYNGEDGRVKVSATRLKPKKVVVENISFDN